MQTKSEMINRIAELAEENAKLNAIIDGYQPRLQKYKDILQEIKEIIKDCDNGKCFTCKYNKEDAENCVDNKHNEILGLITKAEEE